MSVWDIFSWWSRWLTFGISVRSLNKIGYLLGLPTKKLDSIIYYERYVVIQPGVKAEDGVAEYDLLSEEEYLDILDTLPKDNQYLEDNDPNKFIAKMGAEAIYDCWLVWTWMLCLTNFVIVLVTMHHSSVRMKH